MQALLAVCPGSISVLSYPKSPDSLGAATWAAKNITFISCFLYSWGAVQADADIWGGTSRNTAEKLVSTLGEVWTPVLSAHLQSLWTCCLSGSAVFLTCATVSAC